MNEAPEDRLTAAEREWAARSGLSEATALFLKVHGHGRYDLARLDAGIAVLNALVDVRLRADRWRRALRAARKRAARSRVAASAETAAIATRRGPG